MRLQFAKINTVQDTPPGNMVDVCGAFSLAGWGRMCFGPCWSMKMGAASSQVPCNMGLVFFVLHSVLQLDFAALVAGVIESVMDWATITKRDGTETQVGAKQCS